MDTSPISRAPLALTVSSRIRDAIIDGTLALGEVLPTEHELTQMFGVSRPTVREAVRVLQAQGLVTGGDSVSTARPRVTAQLTTNSAATALSTALQVGAVPLGDLVDLRVVLERAAMEGVSQTPTDAAAAIEAMEAACTHVDVSAFHDADADFHLALAAAGGNQIYGLVMGVLRDCIARYLREHLEAEPDREATLRRLLAEHREILSAVEAGDRGRAADLLEAHIRNYYDHTIDRLASPDPPTRPGSKSNHSSRTQGG